MWFLGQVSVAKFIVAFFLLLPPLIPCHSTWVFFACCLLKRPSLSSYADYDQILTPLPPASNHPHPTWSPIETRIQGLGCHFTLMGITCLPGIRFCFISHGVGTREAAPLLG